MRRQEGLRETVQPLVRHAAARASSLTQLVHTPRAWHRHACRGARLLAELRRHRAPSRRMSIMRALAVAGYQDTRRLLARAGVAVFSLSLVLPTIVHGAAHADALVASVEDAPSAQVEERISLPNFRELAPTPVPAPDPTPAPRPPAVASLGGPALRITASWYGPGFYDNRLPCWQWLQANGLPIQFEPDTWGVAHKTLPCGTMLTLSHGANTITVPVVDRGPYIAGREIDLSPRVKAALGCSDLCSVLMQVR
jgi:rare lipoprotein A (RlpA)-like double-psi beta-barrel protein